VFESDPCREKEVPAAELRKVEPEAPSNNSGPELSESEAFDNPLSRSNIDDGSADAEGLDKDTKPEATAEDPEATTTFPPFAARDEPA
tara:strand:- start:2 stop:265 length:264 start_codon:yes stop_codon:yes gene_type:complete